MLFFLLRNCCRIVAGGFVFLQALNVLAAPAPTPHVRVSLISEQSSIQPGRELSVGFYFQLEKGWHIYWINPGDSGEPPRVVWNLPSQIQASPLEWPAPQRLENGPLVDYGYEHKVLLMTTLRPAGNLKTGGAVELKAGVKWLVCHDICIPERQSVALSLPVRSSSPKPDSRWRKLFDGARSQLPKHVPAALQVTAASLAESFVLTVRTGVREPNATFFPLEPLQIRNAAPQQATPLSRGVRLSLRKSDQLLHPISALKGVLVLSHGRAYAIKAKVTSRDRPE